VTAVIETGQDTNNRLILLRKYESKITPNRRLDRSLVSFQANKKNSFFKWYKYKEGFSADLVRYIISESGKEQGVLLDPFAGIGTSLFVGRSQGWEAIGIELLPIAIAAIEARLSAERVNPNAFRQQVDKAAKIEWEEKYDPDYRTRHVPITEGAFPQTTERALAGYRAYCDQYIHDPHIKKLFELAGLAILEEVSYTRKDGQYLRWDSRAQKKRLKSSFNKGLILDFNHAIRAKLGEISFDLCSPEGREPTLFRATQPKFGGPGILDLHLGSSLNVLPNMNDKSVDLVITSPPYCNRYDYTRTYALELVYLGYDNERIKQLRQLMLSSTVENKAKTEYLRTLYIKRSRVGIFEQVRRVFDCQSALQEVFTLLESKARAGKLNNSNIPRMVQNYFFEMCFIIFELSRVLRPGGLIAMVNDNVRYAGEEIPVDLILSDFANSFGLNIERIWTLSRGKGNSSQQMGRHGRDELRKCVYLWRRT